MWGLEKPQKNTFEQDASRQMAPDTCCFKGILQLLCLSFLMKGGKDVWEDYKCKISMNWIILQSSTESIMRRKRSIKSLASLEEGTAQSEKIGHQYYISALQGATLKLSWSGHHWTTASPPSRCKAVAAATGILPCFTRKMKAPVKHSSGIQCQEEQRWCQCLAMQSVNGEDLAWGVMICIA